VTTTRLNNAHVLSDVLEFADGPAEARTWCELTYSPCPDLEQVRLSLRQAAAARVDGEAVVLVLTGCGTSRLPLDFADDWGEPRRSPWVRYSCDTALLARDDGDPVGLLDLRLRTRRTKRRELSKTERERENHVRELVDWRGVLKVAGEAIEPSSSVVFVADRASNLYTMFAEPRPAHVHLLVRVFGERRLAGRDKALVSGLKGAPVVAEATVGVESHARRPARQARLQLRAQAVVLEPPGVGVRGADPQPLELSAVWATETDPPGNQKAVDWLLLTDLPYSGPDDAVRWATYYGHRGLLRHLTYNLVDPDGGSRDEPLDLGSLDQDMMARYVLAWRAVWLARAARERRQDPCTLALAPGEWEVHYLLRHDGARPPAKPPTLDAAARSLAGYGGFLGRKCDGAPSARQVRAGLQQLCAALAGAAIARSGLKLSDVLGTPLPWDL